MLLEEDKKNNHRTLATIESDKKRLEKLATKAINFIINLMDSYTWKSEDLKAVIKENCINLVLFSIILNKKYYSEEYLEKISQFIPFGVDFLEEIRGEYNSKMFDKSEEELMEIIDEIVKAEE